MQDEGEDIEPFRAAAPPPRLHRVVPVTAQLDDYDTVSLRKDAVAGFTVAALAIPSAMGFAEVAGLPPVAGLYALLLPVVAYAVLGTSRQLVVGPEGASAALVATAVGPLAASDPGSYASLAGLLALLVGGLYLAARTVRLGWVADYLSRAALVGFVHGVALTLLCGQLGKLTGVGIDADKPVGQLAELFRELGDVSLTTFVTGLVALAVLLGIKARWPKVPGPLIVVVGAIVVSAVADLAAHGVANLGEIPGGLPSFTVPRGGLGDVVDLLPAALGILFLTYADSILTARSFAGRHGQHVRADQELLALGVANLAAGITQSFPIGNSNSRTTVNDEMGVRSQVAGLISVGAVVAVLLFLTTPVSKLPSSVLGAVIVYAAIGLISPRDLRSLRAVSRADFVIALAALAGVVLVGVLQGILLAVVLSILHVVRRSARPHDAVLGWVPRLGRYADVRLHPSAVQVPGVVVYRLDDRLFFANADYVKGRVREAMAASAEPVARLVFDAEGLAGIDSTGAEALASLIAAVQGEGIVFAVARLKAPVLQELGRAGLVDLIGRDRFHPTVRDAVEATPAEG